jgi:hypothetical protein
VLDLIARGHGGTSIVGGGQPAACAKRLRRKRRSLRARGERRGSGGKSNGEFQKVPAFHDISSLVDS